ARRGRGWLTQVAACLKAPGAGRVTITWGRDEFQFLHSSAGGGRANLATSPTPSRPSAPVPGGWTAPFCWRRPCVVRPGRRIVPRMRRRPRRATGGLVYHVMNRGARRLPLFESEVDYRMFLMVLREAQTRVPLRLLSYVLMPNHWHLIVWPDRDDQLSR